MPWQTPKTNWASADVPAPSDFNRIEGNAAELKSAIGTHKFAPVLDHPDGSVTDAKIGSRTINDTSVPSGNTGTLTSLLGWLAYMIKAITGKSSWRTVPATTLEAAAAHIARTDNPHAVTKAQVGLGSVDNYPTASQAEAEAGTAANRFMTPQRTKQYVDTRLQNGLTLRDHNGTVERWNQQKGEWEPVAAVFPVGQPRWATLSLTSEQNNAYYTVLDISGASGRLEFVRAQASNNAPGYVFYMRVTVDGKSDELSVQSNTTANMFLDYLVRPYGGSANNLVGDVSDPIYFQNSVKVEIKKTNAVLSATVRYRLAAGTP
jgi:hypothetical protein